MVPSFSRFGEPKTGHVFLVFLGSEVEPTGGHVFFIFLGLAVPAGGHVPERISLGAEKIGGILWKFAKTARAARKVKLFCKPQEIVRAERGNC